MNSLSNPDLQIPGWPAQRMRAMHALLQKLLKAGALCMMLAICPFVPVQAADLAWTLDQVSSGLESDRHPVISSFGVPPGQAAQVPADARITRVYAARNYAGSALLDTKLCWGSVQGPCISMQGSHLNSHAFDGLSARGPLLLVHSLRQWANDTGPLFIRGTVTVWYGDFQP